MTDWITKLSKDARLMLLSVSRDSSGMLLCGRDSGGTFFQANEVNLCEDPKDPRQVAHWESVIKELLSVNAVEPIGQSYKLTQVGYDISDLVKEHDNGQKEEFGAAKETY